MSSSGLDGAHEELRRSLQELQMQQKIDDDGVTLTDRSDGRADTEPSIRVSVPTGSASLSQEQVHLPPIQRYVREGYGFRPQSGASTPLTTASTASPITDPNGLGWPGALISHAIPGMTAHSQPKPSYPRCLRIVSQIHRLPIECHSCRTYATRAEDGICRKNHPGMHRRGS